jgi:superfamily I DNA/RNA helicase
VRYFKRFLQDYPDAEIISLKQNYRSTQTILDASFQVISASGSSTGVESRVFSKIKGVKKLSIIEAFSEKAEAVSIGQCVEKMVGGIGFYSIDFDRIDGTEEDVSRSFSDFAVLYRTRDQGDIIADVFHKAGIPCQVASREDALYKKGMAEIVSFLKVIEGIGSYPDLERIIDLTGIEIGAKFLDKFSAWGLRNGLQLSQALQNIRHFTFERIKEDVRLKFDEFLLKLSAMKSQMQNMDLEKKTKYILENPLLPPTEKKKENLKTAPGHIVGIMQKFRSRKFEFLSQIALESDTDIYNPQSEKVTLLTMHAAKGLEFPVVFISGCEKGFVPFQRSNGKTGDLNEERRLFYVAMTRAKKRLFLTYAKKRIIHGQSVTRELSPFVKDIEKKLRQHETPYIYRTNTELAFQLKLF